MANVSRVNGFRPVLHTDGSPWNGQVTRYFASASDGTAIFQGDLVKLSTASDTQGQVVIPGVGSIGGTPGVAKFVAGTDTAAVGVAVGFTINPLNLNSPQYRAASTASYVLVADSPDTVFEVQYTGTIAATSFNKNVDVADAGGSTVTGQSGMSIPGSGGVATTATLTLRIHGAIQRVDNDITTANSRILVYINNHQLSAGTGAAGV